MSVKPKDNHPWRRYKDKLEREAESTRPKIDKTVKVFVAELVENWDNIQVNDEYDRKFVADLSASRQAAFLIGLLKKAYGGRDYDYGD